MYSCIHIKYFYKTKKYKKAILLFWYAVDIKTKCISVKTKLRVFIPE